MIRRFVREFLCATVAMSALGCGTPDENARAASDAGTVDATTRRNNDGAVRTNDGSMRDAGACALGTKRCVGSIPETCDATGHWQTSSACVGATPFCIDGGCDSTPPSCRGGGDGLSNCGPKGNESCCASPPVSGGTFYRAYDGVTHTDKTNPATVSSFRLDRFEITVGRFRRFVSAWVAGWRPRAGDGKHAHLNGGAGLNGGTENGWDATWTSSLPTTASAWNTTLQCDTRATWTAAPGANEALPASCYPWVQAYAFCIWDSGFLPTDAEWNYAAAGGGGTDGQRVYPWSAPPTSPTIDCNHANYGTCSTKALKVGSLSPTGDGKWGQADLSGNVWEWSLDVWVSAYIMPCDDCANLGPDDMRRVVHGGGFTVDVSKVGATEQGPGFENSRSPYNGARCARPP